MKDLIERYRKLYAGVIYDAMCFDMHYRNSFVLDRRISQVAGSEGVIVGEAFTCRGSTTASDDPARRDTIRLEVFEAMPVGCVVLMDTGRNERVAHFGDISAMMAVEAGVDGVVIDGYTRDAYKIDRLGLSVFARGVQPQDAYGWWALDCHSEIITLATSNGTEFEVRSHDIVFADRDGVLIIPWAMAIEILEMAEKRAVVEDEIRQAITAGERPTDIHRRLGRW
jgi:4-hydroxy-4-methyl-2-oxoglutarate aldolase